MAWAYYNENDEYAANWLEKLIARGLIAPGVVDRRSIEDVHPYDLKGFSNSTISLPASADGPSPSGSLAGPTRSRSGQGLVRVNRSRALGAVAANGMSASAIYGQYGTSSLLQSALMSSLESRLPKPQIGTMRRAMTWRAMAMPSGRLTCRLSVSVAIMRALGFTLSATPTAKANQSAPSMSKWPGCREIEVSPHTWCDRMGYPPAWLQCAGSATRSIPKSPQRSSRRRTK